MNYCPHCGIGLGCPYCKAAGQFGAYCSKCGEVLFPSKQQQSEPAPEPKKAKAPKKKKVYSGGATMSADMAAWVDSQGSSRSNVISRLIKDAIANSSIPKPIEVKAIQGTRNPLVSYWLELDAAARWKALCGSNEAGAIRALIKREMLKEKANGARA